jgi:hypothetical protein
MCDTKRGRSPRRYQRASCPRQRNGMLPLKDKKGSKPQKPSGGKKGVSIEEAGAEMRHPPDGRTY